MDQYPQYEGLKLDRPDTGVLRITLARGKANAMDYQMHHDLGSIWPLIDQDSRTSAVILAGAGKLFSAGGDFETEQKMIDDWRYRTTMWKDARVLIENLLSFSKPLISAINGAASGAGLAAALMADVAIMARSAKLVDGHTRLGVAAGDHGGLVSWRCAWTMINSKPNRPRLQAALREAPRQPCDLQSTPYAAGCAWLGQYSRQASLWRCSAFMAMNRARASPR
jgi:enoyl-CoA hydratase